MNITLRLKKEFHLHIPLMRILNLDEENNLRFTSIK